MYRRCRCFALLQPASQISGRVQQWVSTPTYVKPASSRYCAQSHGIPYRDLAGVWTLISHLPPFRRANLSQRRRIISRVSSMDGGCMLCSFFSAVFLQCFPRQNSHSLHLRLSKPPIDHQAVFSLRQRMKPDANTRWIFPFSPSQNHTLRFAVPFEGIHRPGETRDHAALARGITALFRRIFEGQNGTVRGSTCLGTHPMRTCKSPLRKNKHGDIGRCSENSESSVWLQDNVQ